MTTALTTQSSALALSDEDVIDILTGSLYPGANRQSVKLVLGYCKAAGLDPMQKPVHIVPMWDNKAKQMRDVVMPGVGLYRTQASRTGTFAGQSEPEFGPMVDATIGGAHIVYPEWAKVTVKKTMANGFVAEFTAVEYWIENYAVKGGQEKSVAPNAMWSKRPRGQIAKCAAAQALRLAFPEMGAQPTAEEMEGKTLQDEPHHHAPTGEVASPELSREADEAAQAGEAAYQTFWKDTGKDNRKLLGAGHEGRKATALQADRDRTIDEMPSAHEFTSDQGEPVA